MSADRGLWRALAPFLIYTAVDDFCRKTNAMVAPFRPARGRRLQHAHFSGPYAERHRHAGRGDGTRWPLLGRASDLRRRHTRRALLRRPPRAVWQRAGHDDSVQAVVIEIAAGDLGVRHRRVVWKAIPNAVPMLWLVG